MVPSWRLALPLVLALAAGVGFARFYHSPRAADAAATDALWQASYPDARGRMQALAQWRGGPLVVNFWASWCAPCREEMPDFDALHRQYRTGGVEFVGLAIDTPAQVRDFLRQYPVGYPILIGEGGAHGLARILGNTQGALPYTVVLDREGRIIQRHLGRLPRTTLETTLRGISP